MPANLNSTKRKKTNKGKRTPPFIWGAATSALQIEGAALADGKGLSIWDTFSARKGKIKDGTNPAKGSWHYERWREDVALMAKLGLAAYRFSISWPRVMPEGTGRVNQRGVDFYRRLVDQLLKKNIRPYVTLYHWDLPQILQDKGGWTNRDIVHWFSEYCAQVDKALGPLVDSYIVLNEPFVYTVLGYLLGVHAPGRRGFKNFFAAAHYSLLAQGAAARVLRSANRKARIGTTVSCTAAYPLRAVEKDMAAARRFDAFYNRMFVDPVVGRGYPAGEVPFLRKIERYIKDGDLPQIQFDFDFWGINTYTTKVVKANRLVPYLGFREISRGLPRTEMGWEIDPRGIYTLLKQFGSYPEIKELMITENGAAFADTVVAGRVHDRERIEYLREHIAMAEQARAGGVNLTGYFVWSLLDNFEWAEGYRPRFGIIYVDYVTGARILKDSALWYRDYIKANRK